MGVHGLTTFISYYQDQYKEKVYLRDSPVLIDGCNLMYHLYFDGRNSVVVRGPQKVKSGSGSSSSGAMMTPPKRLPHAHLFCGDWEQYAQNVRYFFQQLKQCNIIPIVLFDGAYDAGKLEVARVRFAKSVTDNIRQDDGKGVAYPGKAYTPIFLKTVFLEVLDEQKVVHYQTIGEADSTIAFIARLLKNCPILSCDSDFYIYVNATMIPLTSLKFAKAAPGKKNKSKAGIQIQENQPPSKIWTLQGEFVSLHKLCKQEFKLQNTRLLGLAAAILGNDIIQHRVFKNFQSGCGSMTLKARISNVMHWLAKQETIDEAIKMLVDHVPGDKRQITEEAIRLTLKMYEGEGGETLVWQHLKSDIDLSEFIDQELETKIAISESITEDNGKDNNMKEVDLTIDKEFTDSSLKVDTFTLDDLEFDHEEGDDDGPIVEQVIDDLASLSLDNARSSKKFTVDTGHLPDWYVKSHTLCQYQSYLLNILKNQIVFLVPQVEIYEAVGSHEFSVPIIQLTAGILISDSEIKVELVTRHKGKMYSQATYPVTALNHYGELPRVLPCNNVDELVASEDVSQKICHEDRVKILTAMLGIYDNLSCTSFFQGWPAGYRIWVATLMYYAKRLNKTRRKSHETLAVLSSIFLCIIKNLIINPGKIAKTPPENHCLSAISRLLTATDKDATKLYKIRKFYKRFEDYSEVTGRKFMRSYDIRLSYCLSEYLNIVFHTEMLNNLLGNPFKSPKIRYTMNNFFIYNFAHYIMSNTVGSTGHADEISNIADVVDVEDIRDVLLEFLNVACNVENIE